MTTLDGYTQKRHDEEALAFNAAMHRKMAIQQSMAGGPLDLLARTPWWIMLPAAALAVAVIFFMIRNDFTQVERDRALLSKARDLWYAECTKPVDECATAWESYELRRLYAEKVGLKL